MECAFGMLVARWGILRMASIPAQLDEDVEYMLNKHEDGYVAIDSSDDHGITMPTALMDVAHHFDVVPRNIQ